MIYVAAILFAALCLVGAYAVVLKGRLSSQALLHEEKLAAFNKVGKWYEHRVEELEEETRQLAGQVVASGGVGVAMPAWPSEPDAEYAYDPTGLVRERLDPRDVPVA